MKPGTRGLFKAIERLLEMANVIGNVQMMETRGLAHENCLVELAMEKNILNVQLTERPLSHDSKRENKANSRGFDN